MIFELEEDEKNLQILNFVLSHPRASIPEIGAAVELGDAAVQKRLVALTRDLKMSRDRVVNLDALGYIHRFTVHVGVEMSQLTRINAAHEEESELPRDLREIKEIKEGYGIDNAQAALALKIMTMSTDSVYIENIHIVMGVPHADLALTARTKDISTIFRFVTDRLRGISCIRDTQTYIEAWSVYRDPKAIKYLDSWRSQSLGR